jgi:hypothetical protein
MAEVNDSLFIALGLKPDSDTESAVIAASDLSDIKRKILLVTKTSSTAEALGVIQANALSAERFEAAERKLAKIEQEQSEKEFDLLAKAGDLAGKFTPAMAKSEWAQELRAKGSAGVQELKSFLQHAPTLVSRKPVVEDLDDASAVELSQAEVEVAKKMCGDDKVALSKRLDALRAGKLEDIRMRKAVGR